MLARDQTFPHDLGKFALDGIPLTHCVAIVLLLGIMIIVKRLTIFKSW